MFSAATEMTLDPTGLLRVIPRLGDTSGRRKGCLAIYKCSSLKTFFKSIPFILVQAKVRTQSELQMFIYSFKIFFWCGPFYSFKIFFWCGPFYKSLYWICYNIASVFSCFCRRACETLVPWLRLPCPSSDPGVCSNSCPLHGWCHPTISLSVEPLLLLPSLFPSIRVFSNESVLHIWWPRYWSFSFSISPYNEHSGLISFRMDWLDLLAVQGTLKSLLQHHSSKASILLQDGEE